MTFDKNVFINCPFDLEYRPILKAVFFCLVTLDYNPLLSETVSSSKPRLEGILELIEKSKYSIHDLSRMKASKKGDLSRSNMPFELGLDVGCIRYGKKIHKSKCLLIFDEEQYRYQKSISDIAGSDIEAHGGKPLVAIRKTRNWIYRLEKKPLLSGNSLWDSYNIFLADFEIIAKSRSLSQEDIDEMPWGEFQQAIQDWLKGRR